MKSAVWGNKDVEVSQGFGVYNSSTASMYDYASDYGYAGGTHIGLDVAVPRGTPIFAATDGKVIQAGFAEFFRPSPVIIEQKDGQQAIYGHLWTNLVQTGDEVKAGQQIGTSGEQTVRGTWTPDGTGPHIHFELRKPDTGTTSGYRAVDPTNELTGASGVPVLGGGGGGGSQLGFNFGGGDSAIWKRGILAIGGIALTLVGINALTGGGLTNIIKKGTVAGRIASVAS